MTTTTSVSREVNQFVDSLWAWRSKVVPPSQVWKLINTGKATRNGLKVLVREMYQGALANPRWVAAMLSHHLDDATFMRLAENFSREAGYYMTENHVSLLLKWAGAMGITKEELDAHIPLPETIGMLYTVEHFCKSSIEEGIGAFNLALEKPAEAHSEEYPVNPLQSIYGFTPEQLLFFSEHKRVEPRDAHTGLELVGRFIGSQEQRDKVTRAFKYASVIMGAREKRLAELVVAP